MWKGHRRSRRCRKDSTCCKALSTSWFCRRSPPWALHGYGIARSIEQVSGDEILLKQGIIYASLVRLQQRALIKEPGVSPTTTAGAKFYSITASGQKRLKKEADDWRRLAAVMGRLFAAEGK